MTRDDTYRRTFLGLLVVTITVAFIAVLRNFLVTLLLAGIFSAILHPFYKRVVVAFRGHRNLASAATLVITLLVVVVPMIIFGRARRAGAASEPARGAVDPRPAQQPNRVNATHRGYSRLRKAGAVSKSDPDQVGEAAGTIGTFTVNKLSSATKGTLAFGLQLVILIYAMFFFLVSGAAVLAQILDHIPLSKREMGQIVGRFVTVTRAALISTMVVGVIQGALGGIGFWVAGIPGAVFWGTLMAVLSMIPGVGATLVWLPASIYLITSGHVVGGMLLFAYCAIIVGSIDNVLRPRLVGKDTKLHDLVVLLSTLGGIMLMGVVGFIIGPVIAALFITIWDIYATSMRGTAGMTSRVQPPRE